jgi:transcriptional regulator with XRE-family HTH domain
MPGPVWRYAAPLALIRSMARRARSKRFLQTSFGGLLSAVLYIIRSLRRLDQRSAAKAIGVSSSTVCRVEAGKPVSMAAMIKVCAFIGVHPDGYTAPLNCLFLTVSRETPTETCCPDLENGHGRVAHA